MSSTERKTQDEICKEGDLQIMQPHDLEQPVKQIWIQLKGNCLYCYENKDENKEATDIVDLKLFNSVRGVTNKTNDKRATEFKLISTKKSLSRTFKAVSVEDKNEWIKCLRKVLPDSSYGTTVKVEHTMESICSIWIILLFVTTIVLFAMGARLKNATYHIIFITVSLYEINIIILCAYYCCKFSWNDVKRIIILDKFWIQSLFCWLFNIIAFILIINHLIHLAIKDDHSKNWYYANSMMYLFGAFSIPFPAICMKLHREYKYKETNEISISKSRDATSTNLEALDETSTNFNLGTEQVKIWLSDIVKLQQYSDTFIMNAIDDMEIVATLTEKDLEGINIKLGHRKKIMKYVAEINNKRLSSISKSFNVQSQASKPATSIQASKPIFRDNILKGIICAFYVAHFLIYVGYPAFRQNKYEDLMDIMYNDQEGIYDVLYKINHIFLRAFMGMSLISVFFTFIAELTDKHIANTNLCVIFDIVMDKWNECGVIIVVSFCIISAGFEALRIRKSLYSDYFGFNYDKTILYTNVVWIIINGIAVVMLWMFFRSFWGIYNKTKHNYTHFWHEQSPTSPIKAFVLESAVLLSLYLIYIAFLLINGDFSDYTNWPWDIYRQSVILMLLFFQFVTLIRVKQIQKFGETYLERFNLREKWILHGYYKFMCILLIYNIIYIFIFEIDYFGSMSIHSIEIYEQITFAISFSLPSLMIFILSHFISSYHQWKYDLLHRHSDDNYLSISEHPNSILNKALKSQSKKKYSSKESQSMENPLIT